MNSIVNPTRIISAVCSNYVSVSTQERLLHFFGVYRDDPKMPPEIWPTGLAPFIRKAEPDSGNKRVAETGYYGLIPSFSKEVAFGRRTYNSRSETVHQLPSFRESWRKGWRCIVPAEILFEPYYETDTSKPVRWAISRPGSVPMGVAGIYCEWTADDGRKVYSFAMLTVNADAHPFYNKFHRHGEEKRMPIVLDESEYDDWLACDVKDASRYFRLWYGQLDGKPAPLPSRAPAASSVRTSKPRLASDQSDLF
jgi:putative SOS response-associated peptidase YedK